MEKKKKTFFETEKGVPFLPGVSKTPKGINFSVEVPRGRQCELRLYKKAQDKERADGKDKPDFVFLFTEEYRFGNIVSVCLLHFPYELYEYEYWIDGRKRLDPYAVSLEREQVFGDWNVETMRAGFWEAEFDWEDDRAPRLLLSDVILYCMHVRGFTKHISSKVQKKGTFAGVMEKIPYLKELGVNQIELMPVYEFAEVIQKEEIENKRYQKEKKDVLNYWGYGRENYYYALKRTYAATKNPQREFKMLVRELHKNGMELILEFYFDEDCPQFAILNCLKYWALEYHVDGFHITGYHDLTQELERDPFFAELKLYMPSISEEGIERVQKKKRIQAVENVRHMAVYAMDYLTHMRSFLKGDTGKTMGVIHYLRRNQPDFGYVNFFSCHDGFTMADMVSYDRKHNEANEEGNQDGCSCDFSWNCGEEGRTRKKNVQKLRLRQMKNAWVMLLLGQGIPAILAGDEWGNSQNGNNNAYCQDNEVGWVNWRTLKCYEELYPFVRKLIQLRKEHPIFHMETPLNAMDKKGIGYPDISYHSDRAWYMEEFCCAHQIGILYCGEYVVRPDGEHDDFFYLAINMDWRTQSFAVPDLPKGRKWYPLLSTADNGNGAEFEEGEEMQRVIVVKPRTIEIIVGKKVQEKQKNAGKPRKIK